MNGERPDTDGPPTKKDAAPPLEYFNYRSHPKVRRQLPAAVQALIGFVVTGGTSAVFNVVAGLFALANPPSRQEYPQDAVLRVTVVVGLVLVPLIFFGWTGWAMHRRGRWPSFLPGALAGWGVAALAGGICFISSMR